MGVELPHFSTFPLNDSATGGEVIHSYYREYQHARDHRGVMADEVYVGSVDNSSMRGR
jgi:hypothetical protein